MFFTVIIPTCNRNDLLKMCLDPLSPANQGLDNTLYEVIVSDDSKLNNAKLLIERQYPWAKWIEGPKKGPAANRNNGAKSSSGDWLIFIDDDCLPSHELLAEYLKEIQHSPHIGAFEGSIYPDDENLLKKDMAECPVNIVGDCFWSANVCIKKICFEKINGFDEDFIIAAHEDQLLYLKLKEVTEIKFVSLAKVFHPVRFASLKKKILKSHISLRNWLLYTRKMGTSYREAIRKGFVSQIVDLKNNLSSVKVKSSILNLYTIFIGLPILMLNHGKKN